MLSLFCFLENLEKEEREIIKKIGIELLLCALIKNLYFNFFDIFIINCKKMVHTFLRKGQRIKETSPEYKHL